MIKLRNAINEFGTLEEAIDKLKKQKMSIEVKLLSLTSICRTKRGDFEAKIQSFRKNRINNIFKNRVSCVMPTPGGNKQDKLRSIRSGKIMLFSILLKSLSNYPFTKGRE